ncbi:MAG TPA: serine/threonine protein kinase [Polyangiaceae bacterium]|nr:serine/threonine protein kinase [Polyangiaceae bacterium]
MIGSTIDGKFLIKELLGQGGMGSVYAAEHTATGRRCAVKVINSTDLTKNSQILSRFEREARAAGAIDTQYITQVLDAGVDRDSGLPFLAMEYMEGEDLQHLLKRVGPISPDLTLRIIAQACLGLQKAHEANVVHRDIKPHNLFLARRDAGEVVIKLLDFGIAKVKMDQAQSKEGMDLTKTGNLLGSPLYVSPEQARGKRQIDHRTDIYSLGAVMYQALCGQTPFQHATALGELILMVCTEPPASVQDHAPWVTPEVAAICHRCLEKNPAERYQSAEELFEAVRPLLSGGWAIHEDMLVSLEDSQRQEQAPRLPMSLPPPALVDSSEQTGDRSNTRTAGLTAAQAATDGSTTDAASTTGPLTNLAAEAPPPKSKAPMLFGVVAIVGLAGAGIWAMTRDPAGTARETTATTPTPQPEPTTVPVETSEPAQTAAPEPEPEPKRVKVVILPSNAKVEVEGEPAEVKDGLLELEGKPGKVFKVRAYQGISETEAEVVVTESGALPPKIEVKLGQKLKLPRGGATASAPKPAPAPPPSLPPAIKTDTDEFD